MHGPIVLLLLVNICSTFMGEWQYIFNKNQSLFIQGVFEVEVFLLTCDSMRCSKEF
jgi:hypothetical protein